MKQESELVSFNIDARTVTLRFDTEETLRLFVAKYVELLAAPSAVSPQMSPPAVGMPAGDPRSPGDGEPTTAVVVGSQGGARPGEGGGVIEDDEHRWWTCYHEPTCLSLDAHRRKDEARSHCGRDPSVIGCCGGTDDTCSCECNTCMDPNEPPPRSRSNEARRCHACDQVRVDVGELPDTLPLCAQCVKAHRMGYRCGEEAAALEQRSTKVEVEGDDRPAQGIVRRCTEWLRAHAVEQPSGDLLVPTTVDAGSELAASLVELWGGVPRSAQALIEGGNVKDLDWQTADPSSADRGVASPGEFARPSSSESTPHANMGGKSAVGPRGEKLRFDPRRGASERGPDAAARLEALRQRLNVVLTRPAYNHIPDWARAAIVAACEDSHEEKS